MNSDPQGSQNAGQSPAPRRQLTLLDSTCIIVGIIIGATIYESAPLIAASVDGPESLLGVWVLGGLLALVGALCYAELTTAYPEDGGDYVYLTRAFGRPMGFLFAWTELWIIRPANIGAMAFVFAKYFSLMAPPGWKWPERPAVLAALAASSVLAVTVLNLLGVKAGKWTQNLLTAVKVLGLAAIALAGFLLPQLGTAAPPSPPAARGEANYYLAIILVMFAYGGWKDMSTVAAEVRNPQRNILRGLVLGAAAVMLIYLLVNAAMLAALGYDGLARSRAAPAEIINRLAPGWGGRLIGVLICVSTLGAINGMVFTGSRIYYALGAEHRLYRWLGRWSQRLNTPLRSLVLQGLVTTALIVLFGAGADGFTRLVTFSAPFFTFFMLLVGVGLFVLRVRDRDRPPSYRVLGYPVTPLLFCLSNLFLFYSSTSYAVSQGAFSMLGALALVALGLVLAIGEAMQSPLRAPGRSDE